MSDAAAKPPMPRHPSAHALAVALIAIRDYARLASKDATGSGRDYLYEIIAMAERGLREGE